MAGIFHTVALPLRRFAGQKLSWPVQDPSDIRTLYLDCATWLTDAGTLIQSVIYLADASIEVLGYGHDDKTVWWTVRGGMPSSYPVIATKLILADGNRENVNVTIPIIKLFPYVPDDAIANGGQVLTYNARPVEIKDMPSMPGGPSGQDLLVLFRAPDIVGTLPLAGLSLGNNGAGSSEYVHEQAQPAAMWDIVHNLNRHPEVTIVTSSGDRVMGGIQYVSASRLTLTFANGFAGVAYLH